MLPARTGIFWRSPEHALHFFSCFPPGKWQDKQGWKVDIPGAREREKQTESVRLTAPACCAIRHSAGSSTRGTARALGQYRAPRSRYRTVY
eukprot:1503603-Rhodomonas_salina.1